MRLFIMIMVTFFTTGAFSQKVVQLNVSCGFGAENSREIYKYREALNAENYNQIKKKLIKGSDIEKVLSAVVITDLMDSSKIALNDKEIKALSEIKNSAGNYEICFTCTYQEEGSIKELFLKSSIGYMIILSGLYPNRRFEF